MGFKSIIAWTYFCISVFLFCSGTAAQTTQNDAELVAAFQRMQATLDLANAELNRNMGADLDLTDQQAQEIRELRLEYSQFVNDFSKLGVGAMNSKAAIAAMLSRTAEFESRLSNNVLLPHQNEFLRVKVLTHTIARYGNNLAAAILANYSDELNLTPSQVEKMQKLKEETEKKIEEAKARFAKEVEAITEKARVEFRDSLDSNQKQILDSYMPPPQTKKSNADR